jgi:hypothetical protein
VIAAMAKPHCCNEAQAAPLHERGPAALSEKVICYLKHKKYRKKNLLVIVRCCEQCDTGYFKQ